MMPGMVDLGNTAKNGQLSDPIVVQHGEGLKSLEVVDVEARDGCSIWLRYWDGSAGKVDLTALSGKSVFSVWEVRSLSSC